MSGSLASRALQVCLVASALMVRQVQRARQDRLVQLEHLVAQVQLAPLAQRARRGQSDRRAQQVPLAQLALLVQRDRLDSLARSDLRDLRVRPERPGSLEPQVLMAQRVPLVRSVQQAPLAQLDQPGPSASLARWDLRDRRVPLELPVRLARRVRQGSLEPQVLMAQMDSPEQLDSPEQRDQRGPLASLARWDLQDRRA
jgi:hypothetical protein